MFEQKAMIEKLTKQLEKRGYRKYTGHYKGEAFGYWKPFGGKAYQVAVLVYDWREMKAQGRINTDFGIQFEFVLGNDGPYSRWDMTICDDRMTVPKFEGICKRFYEEVVLV